MKCPHCNKEIKDNTKFCGGCGKAVTTQPSAGPASSGATTGSCSSCNTTNMPGAKFCKGCGKPITASLSTPETPPASATCPSCKGANLPDAKFCKGCGGSLSQAVASKMADSKVESKPENKPESAPKLGPKAEIKQEPKPAMIPAVNPSEPLKEPIQPVKEVAASPKITQIEPADSEPKSKTAIYAVVGVIIAAMLGGGGYFAYTKFHKETAPAQTASDTKPADSASQPVQATPKEASSEPAGPSGSQAVTSVPIRTPEPATESAPQPPVKKKKSARLANVDKPHTNYQPSEYSPAPVPAPAPSASAIDPAKIEGDLNRTIRNAGIKGINAEVSDRLVATLKGSTTSAYDKTRAMEIARGFKGITRVKDVIFVVEQ